MWTVEGGVIIMEKSVGRARERYRDYDDTTYFPQTLGSNCYYITRSCSFAKLLVLINK